jgi:hypothetical protein
MQFRCPCHGSCAHVIGLADLCLVGAAALFHHFKSPVMITEGKMQYLFDETGRRYLDVSAGEPLPWSSPSCVLVQPLSRSCCLVLAASLSTTDSSSCVPPSSGLCWHRDRQRWTLPS